VNYFSDYLFFFLAALKQRTTRTNPSYLLIFFANVSLVLVKVCHDFVQGGGGAMVAMFIYSLAAQVG
jgi:hypothetical protein